LLFGTHVVVVEILNVPITTPVPAGIGIVGAVADVKKAALEE